MDPLLREFTRVTAAEAHVNTNQGDDHALQFVSGSSASAQLLSLLLGELGSR